MTLWLLVWLLLYLACSLNDAGEPPNSTKKAHGAGGPHKSTKKAHGAGEPNNSTKKAHGAGEPHDSTKEAHGAGEPYDSTEEAHGAGEPHDSTEEAHGAGEPHDSTEEAHGAGEPHDSTKKAHGAYEPDNSAKHKDDEKKKKVRNYVHDENQEKRAKNLKSIATFLDEWTVNDTVYIQLDHFQAVMYRTKSCFTGLTIHASDSEVMTDKPVNNGKLFVELPQSLDPGSDNNIWFCSILMNSTNWTLAGIQASGDLYENRLIGLGVRGKNISGLREPVKITINLTTPVNNTQGVKCVFLNYDREEFDSENCTTQWEPGDTNVTCSCNHFTYFGVLLITVDLSPQDLIALTYITIIGSSVSLVSLVIAVVLFATNRKMREDVSARVHINLATALILLNVHFLSSEVKTERVSTGLCFYLAVAIHYSLLASFCWMALEGFHLYLLLVRVFNIYIRRYILKLCLLGWGVPVIIVSVVIIFRRDVYGQVALDEANSTVICYINDKTVKMASTLGVFSLVFVFNLVMLGVTVRSVLSLRSKKEFGQSSCDRCKQHIALLLGVTVLLGITWGVIFFSFGELTTTGLYLFSILNPLQGLFLFLWFLLSLRKISNSAATTTSETRST